jgi:hypothetical protein
MEWVTFSAIGGIVAAAIVLAWLVRGILASRDLEIQLLTKDVRHLKGNFAFHTKISSEMRDEQIKLQAEVARLAKIVNGKN